MPTGNPGSDFRYKKGPLSLNFTEESTLIIPITFTGMNLGAIAYDLGIEQNTNITICAEQDSGTNAKYRTNFWPLWLISEEDGEYLEFEGNEDRDEELYIYGTI